MYTKEQLISHLRDMAIDPTGTLVVHSSMKAIGLVEGGAETVLDALIEYMKDGLLLLPAHTWAQIDAKNPVFRAASEPSCVGLLTNLFMKKPGVIRSLHPTHSMSGIGRDAEAYLAGETETRTPCSPEGCWGRLYDRHAQILLIGCGLDKNTFLHSIEEKTGVPGRLTDGMEPLVTVAPDGREYSVPQHRHMIANSCFFVKMAPVFLRESAMKYGQLGDAECILGDAVKMGDITAEYLKREPDLFGNDQPLEQ